MSRRIAIVFTLLALMAFLAAAQSSAQASPHTASVTLLTLTPKISVGQQPKFQYSTTGVPSGDTAVLERYLGGGSWKHVATGTPGTNKTIFAPAPSPLGKYTYRMQTFHGTTATATTGHNHDVFAYGNVSIQTLCPHMSNAGAGATRICAKNDTTVGSTDLVTWMAISSATYPNFAAGAKYDPRTSCRSTAFTFTNPRNSSAKTWLKVHQTGHADQVASAGHSTVGHLNATLYGGQVFIDGSRDDTVNNGVFVGGTMSCWTTTGTY